MDYGEKETKTELKKEKSKGKPEKVPDSKLDKRLQVSRILYYLKYA